MSISKNVLHILFVGICVIAAGLIAWNFERYGDIVRYLPLYFLVFLLIKLIFASYPQNLESPLRESETNEAIYIKNNSCEARKLLSVVGGLGDKKGDKGSDFAIQAPLSPFDKNNRNEVAEQSKNSENEAERSERESSGLPRSLATSRNDKNTESNFERSDNKINATQSQTARSVVGGEGESCERAESIKNDRERFRHLSPLSLSQSGIISSEATQQNKMNESNEVAARTKKSEIEAERKEKNSSKNENLESKQNLNYPSLRESETSEAIYKNTDSPKDSTTNGKLQIYEQILKLFIALVCVSLATYLCKFLIVYLANHYENLQVILEFAKRPINGEFRGFPSGHSSTAFVGAAFAYVYFSLRFKILFFILALLVGISRIESLWHTPLQVFCGTLLGFFLALLIFRKLSLKKYLIKFQK